MAISRQNIESILVELEERLRFYDCAPVSWIICGGSALNLLKLNVRTTRDIDLLGEAMVGPENIELIVPEGFPPNVQLCIDEVAQSNSLPANWVNLGPVRIAKYGLPQNYKQRLTEFSIGSHLTLYVIGRVDLIALKLYAAGDDLSPRQAVHLGDLKIMAPTYEELEFSLEWLRNLPDYDKLKPAIESILEELGHGDLAYYS